jgi:hypothetical protein
MEINEILAGTLEAITMLPLAVLIAFMFKSTIKPLKAAEVISLLVSTAYLVFGPLPIQLAVNNQLVVVKAFTHGYLAYMLVKWVLGFVLVFYGNNFVYKKSSNNSLKQGREKASRPLA